MAHDMAETELIRLECWARGLGTLLGSGVTLIRSLRALEQSADTPALRSVLKDIGDRVENGETLSAGMRNHTDEFGDLGIAMVRAGEYAGVLDETVAAWADLLERDIELRDRARLHRLLLRIAEAAGLWRAGDWEARVREALREAQPTARLSLYCYAFGTMLQAGVPFLMATEVATDFLTPEEANAFMEARAAFGNDVEGTSFTAELAARFELPPLVAELFDVGESTGLLDVMALRAGDLLRRQVDREVEAVMESYLEGV